uniref:Uncharacterized protein n=1 Tax=Rhizophora mucronata TaxID=61149 RepID=A0A2P2PQK0_RHIMU
MVTSSPMQKLLDTHYTFVAQPSDIQICFYTITLFYPLTLLSLPYHLA